jgi:hypothetical protein
MREINKPGDILGIDSLLTQAEQAKANPVPKPVPKRKKEEKPFVRRKVISGRPYYYLVQNYYDDQGRRRQRVLEYLGTRKPRANKLPRKPQVVNEAKRD